MYKSEKKTQKYFSQLLFRCMNQRLPIESGRFTRIERGRRTLVTYVYHESHYLFRRSFFTADRAKLIPFDLQKKSLIP